MKWFIRVIYAAVAVLVILVGARFWIVESAYGRAAETLPGMSYGPEDAALTVVEFMDYRCDACRNAHPVVQQAIAEFPDVRFTFRFLPVFGTPSVIEGQVALTAARHGHFAKAHEYLIARETPVTEDDIAAFATSIGQDPALFREEMRQEDNGRFFMRTINLAQVLGIPQTPAFVIGRRVFYPTVQDVTIEDLRREINAARGQ